MSFLQVKSLQELFKIMASSSHLSSTFWTILDSLVTSSTNKMSHSALEHLTVSSESLIAHRTFWG